MTGVRRLVRWLRRRHRVVSVGVWLNDRYIWAGRLDPSGEGGTTTIDSYGQVVRVHVKEGP